MKETKDAGHKADLGHKDKVTAAHQGCRKQNNGWRSQKMQDTTDAGHKRCKTQWMQVTKDARHNGCRSQKMHDTKDHSNCRVF